MIAQYGVDAGVGYAVEYCGEAIDALSMDERMTIANMSIEFGAKMGLMNPDQKTFDYVKSREAAPKGDKFEQAVEDWKHWFLTLMPNMIKLLPLMFQDWHQW